MDRDSQKRAGSVGDLARRRPLCRSAKGMGEREDADKSRGNNV